MIEMSFFLLPCGEKVPRFSSACAPQEMKSLSTNPCCTLLIVLLSLKIEYNISLVIVQCGLFSKAQKFYFLVKYFENKIIVCQFFFKLRKFDLQVLLIHPYCMIQLSSLSFGPRQLFQPRGNLFSVLGSIIHFLYF